MTWQARFPRLAELYAESDRRRATNYFDHPNVRAALESPNPKVVALEAELAALDAESWAVLKAKAAKYVCLKDRWGYSNQLFECFNEAAGYLYLKREGYEEVRFLEERADRRTPDLWASRGAPTAVTEVKTVNESEFQKCYFEIPGEERNAMGSIRNVPDAFKRKLVSSIAQARDQLFAVQDESVQRRIVYLVVRPDFNFHGEEEFDALCQVQAQAQHVEVAYHLLR
jgi:hypothetical protein